MLLAVFLVLWVAVLLAGLAAWGIAPSVKHRGRAWPRWVWPSIGVSALLLAVVLPALAVVYSTGEREARSHTGQDLTEQQIRGREIFGDVCKKCHTLGDVRAAATIGPNLDVRLPGRETIIDAILNGRARGNGQMPAGLTDRRGAEAVAASLTAVEGVDAGR